MSTRMSEVVHTGYIEPHDIQSGSTILELADSPMPKRAF